MKGRQRRELENRGKVENRGKAKKEGRQKEKQAGMKGSNMFSNSCFPF